MSFRENCQSEKAGRLFFSACPFFTFRRNGIVAAAREGIAAQNAPYGEKSTPKGTVGLNRFNRVAGAGRIIAAHRRQVRRNMPAVKAYQREQKLFHEEASTTPSCSKEASMALSIRVLFWNFVFALATKTKSQLPLILPDFKTD